MSIYPEYKATRSLFQPDPGKVPSQTVEISTDKGIKGYGSGGPGAGYVVEQHLTKLLLNEDPFNVERLWDIMWRSTMSYGRMGVVINAISAVDLALWDIAGKALNMPVYKLLGGETKPRLPAYCTGNDIEQHVEFGYKRLKLAIPHGPADGRDGMRKNVDLVKRARQALGPDGDIMLDRVQPHIGKDLDLQLGRAPGLGRGEIHPPGRLVVPDGVALNLGDRGVGVG